MNVDKTQLLVLNRKGKQSIADSVQVSVGDSRLQKQDCVKYLEESVLTRILAGRHILSRSEYSL